MFMRAARYRSLHGVTLHWPLTVVILALSLAACKSSEPPATSGSAARPDAPAEMPVPPMRLEPASLADLPGWDDDTDPRPALDAYARSCEQLVERPADQPMLPDSEFYGTVQDWLASCRRALVIRDTATAEEARLFFRLSFQPYRVYDAEDDKGLFTGYFEPELQGSMLPDSQYAVPLYRTPDDLIRVDLGRFVDELDGRTIRGRVEESELVPYYSRAEIAAGVLEGRGLELLWVNDRVDKFFLQIQGSGRVLLQDSSVVRVGYEAQNGLPYRAIGRDLIEIGALTRENVSLQTIRQWLAENPERAGEIMERNPSYVFFRTLDQLSADDGPVGAQGVPITAERSIAVDRRFIPLGIPLWLDTEAPTPDGKGMESFQRVMIAQDTGGAIRGSIRGDVFWGPGDRAREIAGRMKSQGRYYVLLPRSLEPNLSQAPGL